MIVLPKLKKSEIPGALVITCWRQDDGTIGLTEAQAAEVIRRAEAYEGLVKEKEKLTEMLLRIDSYCRVNDIDFEHAIGEQND